MRRVEDGAALFAALDALLPRLRLSSGLPDRAALARAIDAGRLFAEERDGGLLLLSARDSFFRLRFYLERPDPLLALRAPLPVVTEIACRAGDPRLGPLGDVLADAGWKTLLRRVRLWREAGAPESEPAAPASTTPPEAAALLARCFSPLTGCLPTEAELAEDLAEGRLLALPGALLRYTAAGRWTELRHLAVLPELRRQGLGRALVTAYLSCTADRRSRVWTGADNTAALALYRRFGYREDGWQSRVLLAPDPEIGGKTHA